MQTEPQRTHEYPERLSTAAGVGRRARSDVTSRRPRVRSPVTTASRDQGQFYDAPAHMCTTRLAQPHRNTQK